MRNRAALPVILLLAGAACRRDDRIQTYRVSKEAEPSLNAAGAAPGSDMSAMGASMGLTAAASAQEVEWKVPAGWKELPASAMRVGSFRITGANGQTAEMSVIPLSGMAGGNLANINRWRDQIHLEPISEADLSDQSRTLDAAGRPMLWVDFVSRDPLVDHRYKMRLMAAIYKQGERTWFFKMMGEDATVAAAKPAFLQFLQSLHFHE